ncbi:MAG: ABC transporter permease [Candidatus Cyclobacteriaceae bacterium M2_1C_046]
MLRNYIKVAVRNIFRNKVYAIINILGLTLGITCSSLLLLFVIDELSFDDFHRNKERIYRLVEIDKSGQETRYFGMTAPPVAKAFAEDYPEVERGTRLYRFGGHINFKANEELYHEREYFYADPDLFQVFTANFIEGDPKTALKEPNSLVIDEDWAITLFGTTQNVVGRTLVFGDNETAQVTGVIKNLPTNTHLQYRMLVSVPSNADFYKAYITNWNTYGAFTYFLLEENTDVDNLNSKIPGFIDTYFAKEQQRDFYLQPMADIHFESKEIEYASDSARGEIAYVYIFIAVAIFMLLIACINYMNLATAKSLHRGKEIGIRKVSGAVRGQLITQFLSESTLIALISLIISVGLVDLLLPYFNDLTDKEFIFNTETLGGILLLLLGITLFVGLLSGTYPAFLMSKLRAANILKGQMSSGKGSVRLRKVLVIVQFTLSIIMIIATIITSRQLNYIQNASLGFDNSGTLVVDINSGDVRSRFETLKNEFAKSPHIKGVAVSSRVPGEWKNLSQVHIRSVGERDSLRVNYIGFDEDIIDLYDMEIVEGSNFTGSLQADSLKVLINEKMVEALSLENPVGKFIEISGEEVGQFQISGVVRNFNFQSLHNEIAPLIMGFRANPFQSIDYFSLKFDPAYTQEVIAHATAVHNQFEEGSPIEYHFLDEQWQLFYKNDRRASNVFAIGAGITIFIACLGLFGLASFIIQKRTKEIGVRKILGASVKDLFILLAKTFVGQVLIAFAIAVPVAWYAMSKWLDNFAFKFNLGIEEFLLGGLIALFITIISIGYKVLKAAYLNPAGTLKEE